MNRHSADQFQLIDGQARGMEVWFMIEAWAVVEATIAAARSA